MGRRGGESKEGIEGESEEWSEGGIKGRKEGVSERERWGRGKEGLIERMEKLVPSQ